MERSGGWPTAAHSSAISGSRARCPGGSWRRARGRRRAGAPPPAEPRPLRAPGPGAGRARRLAEQGETYLNPTLKALFPDPSSFMDMDRAAGVLVDALERQTAHGRCSPTTTSTAPRRAAQLVRWFRAMGHELPIYVPDRIIEGYGPSPAAFRQLKAEGAELVVTVDCGAAAHDALACAAEIGLEVVVIDHHLMRDGEIPAVAALVNPNRPDCTSGQGHLAAAGRDLRPAGRPEPRGAQARACSPTGAEPDLRQWLDLAAMGAICDVTQLTGFNRALAAQGLKVMSGWAQSGPEGAAGGRQEPRGRPRCSTRASSWARGSTPAAGSAAPTWARGCCPPTIPRRPRRWPPSSTRSTPRARRSSARSTEARSPSIETESNDAGRRRCCWSPRDGWHPGVIGIVAGRLRETLPQAGGGDRHRPRRQRRQGLGPLAAGREPRPRRPGGLRRGPAAGRRRPRHGGRPVGAARHDPRAARLPLRAAGRPRPRSPRPRTGWTIDALVDRRRGATARLWQDFQRMAPFGPGNPEPVFALGDVRVERPMALRGGHVRCTLTDGIGRPAEGGGLACRGPETGRRLLTEGGAIHVVGRLKPDDWQGPRRRRIRDRGRRRSPKALKGATKGRAVGLAPLREGGYRARPRATRSLRLSVRTPGFQPEERGSTPLGTATRNCSRLPESRADGASSPCARNLPH